MESKLVSFCTQPQMLHGSHSVVLLRLVHHVEEVVSPVRQRKERKYRQLFCEETGEKREDTDSCFAKKTEKSENTDSCFMKKTEHYSMHDSKEVYANQKR